MDSQGLQVPVVYLVAQVWKLFAPFTFKYSHDKNGKLKYVNHIVSVIQAIIPDQDLKVIQATQDPEVYMEHQ